MPNAADGYEQFMVPVLFEPWAKRLVDLVGVRPGDRVIDVGCGTGIVARTVASRAPGVASITGVDVNAEMLAVARRAAERGGADVGWREGSAESLPFPDSGFDLALCQFALMFFADRVAGLREMRRVLVDGGRVGLAVWQSLDRHPFYETLHGVIERRAGISALQDIFSLGDADELRQLLTDAGFANIEVRAVSDTARFPDAESFLAGEIAVDVAAIPALQGMTGPERADVVARITEDMKEPLASVTEGSTVVLPFHANIATAVRQ